MSKPPCEYPGCTFEAEQKCVSCGKMFCKKHIGSSSMCEEDLRKRSALLKKSASTEFIPAHSGYYYF